MKSKPVNQAFKHVIKLSGKIDRHSKILKTVLAIHKPFNDDNKKIQLSRQILSLDKTTRLAKLKPRLKLFSLSFFLIC
ncbi:CLUMA_CG013245, isoform A [Clunio marinus]|uniref:CLUMA_CG013245, isoform A n=1 Tax=Clunio marinus TaxID=568069 RepID=A0A1J1IIA4_9DIPT|nr:CLUMA_CG013245, isoform A [Clunio marinus]